MLISGFFRKEQNQTTMFSLGHRTTSCQCTLKSTILISYFINQIFLESTTKLELTDSSKLLSTVVVATPPPMFQCNVDIVDVYP